MQCQKCGEETDEAVKVKIGSKQMKVCESCAEDVDRDKDVAEQAEGAMQSMMEYKGRR